MGGQRQKAALGGSLAVGTYLQRGSAPTPPPLQRSNLLHPVHILRTMKRIKFNYAAVHDLLLFTNFRESFPRGLVHSVLVQGMFRLSIYLLPVHGN